MLQLAKELFLAIPRLAAYKNPIDMKRAQPQRAIILLIYVGLLFLLNFLAFDNWLPDKDYKGLWFYTGIASILLGNLLVTPFYTKPVDAISYSVLGLVAIFLVNQWNVWSDFDRVVYITSISFLSLVLILSFIGILLKDSSNPIRLKISKSSLVVSDFFGNQRILFSVVILFALIVFHRTVIKEMFFITIAWVIVVVIEPDKHIFYLIERIGNIWRLANTAEKLGFISAYQLPDMILIKQPEDAYTSFGTAIIYKDSHAVVKTGITLNYVGRDEQLLLRAVEFKLPEDIKEEVGDIMQLYSSNSVAYFDYFEKNPHDKSKVELIDRLDELIGIVDEQTTVEKLRFEVFNDDNIEEGCLVEVKINDTPVLYQVLDGLTKEDIVSQKNKYGYARAEATKIGIWDSSKMRFSPAKWLPHINSPVFIKQTDKFTPSINAVGHFPKTNYHVGIENINELVTHNTAILGILGIGKSMLSIELVERMIANKIKVICVDLTDQYAKELEDFYDKPWHDRSIEKIKNSGIIDSDSFDESPEKGGSVNNLIEALHNDLNDYLHGDESHYLKIYNPAQFSATKQLTDPKQFKVGNEWHRGAALWDVTPVEITSIISEVSLSLLQDKTSTNARACLVFEEAHSLIPEWTTVASEGDKSATNRTARAILQGRKYGLGCLLITQRTANVTKTILNQCNSIFAMRTFDDTGKNFIANYIGSEYAEKLSSLQERQAVFYGKASTCENPVMLRLNDRDEFIKVFREKFPPPEIKIEDNKQVSDKDDLPF